jgi:hypothetical protein
MTSIEFGRPFVLHRSRDISDVSGTGIIADGAVWPDGHAVIHWRGRWPLTTPHPDGLDSVLAIHDHGRQGDLDVIWADTDPKQDDEADSTATDTSTRCVCGDTPPGPADECSAQYHGHAPASSCIRAARHYGDHTDGRGFHWSDTVALYPSPLREGIRRVSESGRR